MTTQQEAKSARLAEELASLEGITLATIDLKDDTTIGTSHLQRSEGPSWKNITETKPVDVVTYAMIARLKKAFGKNAGAVRVVFAGNEVSEVCIDGVTDAQKKLVNRLLEIPGVTRNHSFFVETLGATQNSIKVVAVGNEQITDLAAVAEKGRIASWKLIVKRDPLVPDGTGSAVV